MSLSAVPAPSLLAEDVYRSTPNVNIVERSFVKNNGPATFGSLFFSSSKLLLVYQDMRVH